MKNRIHLELLTLEEQLPILRDFLHPSRSSVRAHLALLAIKNCVLRDVGVYVRNEPTLKWYQRQLAMAGVKARFGTVRHQLDRLADFGVLDKECDARDVVAKSARLPGIVKRKVCSYPLNEVIYPVLEQTLKQLVGVDSFYKLTGQEDLFQA